MIAAFVTLLVSVGSSIGAAVVSANLTTIKSVIGGKGKAAIDQQVKDSIQRQSLPIVGEIRAFSFGGQRGDQYIEALRKLGWVECAGQTIGRTNATEDLYDRLNADQAWGKKDGLIKLPDLRGMFLRGWAHGAGENGDPDVKGRAIPTGRAKSDPNSVGTSQASAFQNHDHQQEIGRDGGKQMGIAGFLSENVADSFLHTSGAKTGSVSEKETRPKNVYVLYAIYVGKPLGPNDVDYGDTPNN